jgi:hypothetical protein
MGKNSVPDIPAHSHLCPHSQRYKEANIDGLQDSKGNNSGKDKPNPFGASGLDIVPNGVTQNQGY